MLTAMRRRPSIFPSRHSPCWPSPPPAAALRRRRPAGRRRFDSDAVGGQLDHPGRLAVAGRVPRRVGPSDHEPRRDPDERRRHRRRPRNPRPRPRSPTPSIRADLIKRLGASPTLVGLEIQVRVQNRIVYLFGTVKSRREKAAAEHIAVTEPGVKKVVSLLSVVPGGGGY